MKYAKIDIENIVTQVQPYAEIGFEEVSDDVVCGMVKNVDGTFSVVPPTDAELLEQAKASKLIQIEDDFNLAESIPITYNLIDFYGGAESAESINYYVTLNRLKGVATHSIWDITGTEHNLDDVEASELLILVGNQASTNKFTKKNRKVAVTNATTVLEVDAI